MTPTLQLDIAIEKTLHGGTRPFTLQWQCKTSSQSIVLFGPSGAGKSLSLKLIAGLLQPDRGHIRLNGVTFFDAGAEINVPVQQRNLGFLFQDYALFPHLNARQNIAFGLAQGWFNPRRDCDDERVQHWLKAFDLQKQAELYPAQLSGGQRQRVALARALICESKALLLDEPFAAMDAGLQQRLRAELQAWQQQLQIPMLLISHDETDLKMFGDEVLYLREGRGNGRSHSGAEDR